MSNFLRYNQGGGEKVLFNLLIVVSAFCIAIATSVISAIFVMASFLGLLLCLRVASGRQSRGNAYRVSYGVIFAILLIDLCFFQWQFKLIKLNEDTSRIKLVLGEPQPFYYPETREYDALHDSRLTPNLLPLFLKEASLTTTNDDYVFFRNKRIHDMLTRYSFLTGYEHALGVGSPLMYFSPWARVWGGTESLDDKIKEIFEDAKKDRKGEGLAVFFEHRDIDFIPRPVTVSTAPVYELKMVQQARSTPNRFMAVINAPMDGFLVRRENYHKGWCAFVDGKTTSVYRANYAFQAIRVPSGRHTVVFQFKSVYPILFWFHIVVSAFSWIFLSFYLFRCKENRER